MTSTTFLSIDRYNLLVSACQNEAFTFAFYMLGDERLAGKVVQDIVLQVYCKWSDGDNAVEVKVLQGIVLSCRQRKAANLYNNPREWVTGWNQLGPGEQETLLLVDVLGKSYPYSALILQCSEGDIVRTVSRGRYKLAKKALPA